MSATIEILEDNILELLTKEEELHRAIKTFQIKLKNNKKILPEIVYSFHYESLQKCKHYFEIYKQSFNEELNSQEENDGFENDTNNLNIANISNNPNRANSLNSPNSINRPNSPKSTNSINSPISANSPNSLYSPNSPNSANSENNVNSLNNKKEHFDFLIIENLDDNTNQHITKNIKLLNYLIKIIEPILKKQNELLNEEIDDINSYYDICSSKIEKNMIGKLIAAKLEFTKNENKFNDTFEDAFNLCSFVMKKPNIKNKKEEAKEKFKKNLKL